MTSVGRCLLALLMAAGGVACNSDSDLLMRRDGGAGGQSTGGAGGKSTAGTGGTDAGGAAGAGGEGGTGGANRDASADSNDASQTVSTGTFPYPGRWWGRLTASDRAGAFVIHWSASDPLDRGLWTREHTYALNATPGPEGGVTLSSAAPEMKGCWTLYATSDPSELQVQPCDMPPSSGQGALGFFRTGARLIAQIPLPAPGQPEPNPPIETAASRFGGDGQWIAVSVDDHLYLWKNDAGQVFDLGTGFPWAVDFSPDGRRVVYLRRANAVHAIVAYDTATSSEEVVTSNGGYSSTSNYPQVHFTGVFSPDGRRFAFYDQPSLPDANADVADIAAFDFDSAQTITLAPKIEPFFLPGDAIFLGGSSRIVFRALDIQVGTDGPFYFYGYDFETGTASTLGDANELIGAPGGGFAAYQPAFGPPMLIDAATFTPRALPGAAAPAGQSGGLTAFQTSADGQRLAYLDYDSALQVVGPDGGSLLTLSAPSGCLPDYGQDEALLPDSVPNRFRAAQFTSDGSAIVRAVGAICTTDFNVSTLARYDLGTGEETVVPLPQLRTVAALSPLGQIVTVGNDPASLLWSVPASLVSLDDAPPFDHSGPYNETFSFTDDGRYLTYMVGGYLLRRDVAAGTTQVVAPIYSGDPPVITSKVTGVSVVSSQSNPGSYGLTAYLPDGSSLPLYAGLPATLADARNAAVAYPISDAAGDGTVVYRLQPGVEPLLVGNGTPLAVSSTEVVFRDLDGVCSYSW